MRVYPYPLSLDSRFWFPSVASVQILSPHPVLVHAQAGKLIRQLWISDKCFRAFLTLKKNITYWQRQCIDFWSAHTILSQFESFSFWVISSFCVGTSFGTTCPSEGTFQKDMLVLLLCCMMKIVEFSTGRPVARPRKCRRRVRRGEFLFDTKPHDKLS